MTPGEAMRRLVLDSAGFTDDGWDGPDDWPEIPERTWPVGSGLAALLAECVVLP